MNDWATWLVMAGVLLVFEMFTGTYYLLMIAVGVLLACLAALAGLSVPLQIVVAAVAGLVATAILHRSRFGHPARNNAARDPNMNIDIGQRVTIEHWHERSARVMYRGALWDVELAQGAVATAGSFRIVEIRGSRLIVANSK